MHSIVIAGDGPRADVDSRANLRVSQVSQVIRLRSFAQLDLLGLDKVAHVRALANLTAGTQVRVGAKNRVSFHKGSLKNAAVANEYSIPDRRIANHRIRPNPATRADSRLAQDLNEGLQHGVRCNFYVAIDNAAGERQRQRDALSQQSLALAQPHPKIDKGKLAPRIRAQNFNRVFRLPRHHPLPRPPQQRRHVSQVILAMRIGGGELVNVQK